MSLFEVLVIVLLAFTCIAVCGILYVMLTDGCEECERAERERVQTLWGKIEPQIMEPCKCEKP